MATDAEWGQQLPVAARSHPHRYHKMSLPRAPAALLDGVLEDALGAEVVDAPAEEDPVGRHADGGQHVGPRVLAGVLGYLARLRRDALLTLRQELDVPATERAGSGPVAHGM